MVRHEHSIDMSKYIQFFQLSCNIQTLFYWGRKGELCTSYHIRLISYYKDLKTKIVSWFFLIIGQNASRQLVTSSENLVASAQFLVALATSESQLRALQGNSEILHGPRRNNCLNYENNELKKFSFSCLILNLQWHNQNIAVY